MAEFRGIPSMRMFERGKNWRARIFIKNLMIFAKFSKRKLFFQIFLGNRGSKGEKGALDEIFLINLSIEPWNSFLGRK